MTFFGYQYDHKDCKQQRRRVIFTKKTENYQGHKCIKFWCNKGRKEKYLPIVEAFEPPEEAQQNNSNDPPPAAFDYRLSPLSTVSSASSAVPRFNMNNQYMQHQRDQFT